MAETTTAVEQQTAPVLGEDGKPIITNEPPAVADLDDEALLSQLEKKLGFKPKSLEELKPKPAEPTEEEKAAELSAKEKKRLDKFLAKGKTIEDFTALKRLTEFDPKELSLINKRNELKAAGYDEKEIDEQLKLRYHQYTDEEFAQFGDDAEKMKKLSAYYKDKLENGSKYQIEAAKRFFEDLDKEIDADAYVAKVDAEIISNVEKTVKAMERKMTIELGQSNDQTLNPVQFVVEDKHLAEIQTLLTDKAARENLLYNPDGTENVANLVDLLKWKYIARDLAKAANLQGRTEEVEKFAAKFPDNHFAVAPASVNKTGKLGVAGKVVEGSEKVSFNTSERKKA